MRQMLLVLECRFAMMDTTCKTSKQGRDSMPEQTLLEAWDSNDLERSAAAFYITLSVEKALLKSTPITSLYNWSNSMGAHLDEHRIK